MQPPTSPRIRRRAASTQKRGRSPRSTPCTAPALSSRRYPSSRSPCRPGLRPVPAQFARLQCSRRSLLAAGWSDQGHQPSLGPRAGSCIGALAECTSRPSRHTPPRRRCAAARLELVRRPRAAASSKRAAADEAASPDRGPDVLGASAPPPAAQAKAPSPTCRHPSLVQALGVLAQPLISRCESQCARASTRPRHCR